jgi:hypothetical protein
MATRPSGSKTARRAAALLAGLDAGFVVPTPQQKKNLVIAFAKRNLIIYGKAFDIIRMSEPLDLDDGEAVERGLDTITVFEIKSTNKTLREDFGSYFFALTAAEVLVAQSLKDRFGFILVNVNTGHYLEMTLNQIFARMKAIYPTWSILF